MYNKRQSSRAFIGREMYDRHYNENNVTIPVTLQVTSRKRQDISNKRRTEIL